MAVASSSDVAIGLGRTLSDSELGQVDQWLDDAEMQIRLRLGDVSLLDQDALAFVEREAVILKARNPDGKVSEAIDDYNYRRTEAAALGQVQILDIWWNLLSPDTGAGAFSGRPYFTSDAVRWPRSVGEGLYNLGEQNPEYDFDYYPPS